MAFHIWDRPHWIRDGKLNDLGFFFFFGWWFSRLGLRFSKLFKSSKYWKRDVLLPKVASRPGKADRLLFACPMANVWLLLTKQSPSPDEELILHLGYQFLVQSWLGGVGFPYLTECPVAFDHNSTTHLATHLKFQKMWKCFKYPKQLKFDTVMVFRFA